jgi:hypothetical protein
MWKNLIAGKAPERTISAGRRTGSCSGGTGSRNSHELKDRLVGGQVLIGIESYRDSVSLTCRRMTRRRLARLRMTRLEPLGRGSRCAQNSTPTANRHAFREGYFGGHGERQFDHCSFRERRLGVKEYPAAAQILNKSRHGASFEMDG